MDSYFKVGNIIFDNFVQLIQLFNLKQFNRHLYGLYDAKLYDDKSWPYLFCLSYKNLL